MKKLKSIGLTMLFSALGMGIGIGYKYFTGELPLTEFVSELKSFAGTIFVAVGGAGGVLLLAQNFISAKINSYKTTIDTMVSNNEISADLANVMKETLTIANEKFTAVVNEQQVQISTLIVENKTLRNTNAELVTEIQSYFSAISEALIEDGE